MLTIFKHSVCCAGVAASIDTFQWLSVALRIADNRLKEAKQRAMKTQHVYNSRNRAMYYDSRLVVHPKAGLHFCLSLVEFFLCADIHRMTYDQKLIEHTTTTLLHIDFVSHTITLLTVYHLSLPPHVFPWKQ
jgi:hypothetical protein